MAPQPRHPADTPARAAGSRRARVAGRVRCVDELADETGIVGNGGGRCSFTSRLGG